MAASALGALAYFGTDFYADLKDDGAVQVSTPDDVTTGVAQGIYDAGMTIASSAYAAEKSGSPVTVSWPKPGAVAIYGPIALAKSSKNGDAAREFISYVTSREGQTTIGRAGSYPTLDGIEGPTKPENAPVVHPDWAALGRAEGDVAGGLRQDLRWLAGEVGPRPGPVGLGRAAGLRRRSSSWCRCSR